MGDYTGKFRLFSNETLGRTEPSWLMKALVQEVFVVMSCI